MNEEQRNNKYSTLAHMMEVIVRDIDEDIQLADEQGDGPTEQWFDDLKAAIRVYNYYAQMAILAYDDDSLHLMTFKE